MVTKFGWVLFGLSALILSPGNAGASVMTYSTYASWQAALSSEVDVSLGGVTSSGFYALDSSLTIGSVTFSSEHAGLIIVGEDYLSPRYLDCDVACIQDYAAASGTASPGYITVTLPAGTTAFSFEDFWPDTGGGNLSVSLTGATTDFASETPTFFGFTSTVPFTSVTISAVEQTPNIYDVDYGTVGPAAPEPDSWWLAVAGLAAGALVSRSRVWIRQISR